jgi:photosystem II stability/assembly factor-like uncharacterized protein
MTEDVLERLARSNPVGADPAAPPIAFVLGRIQSTPVRRRWSPRDRRPALLPTLGALTTVAVVALALVLAGHQTRRAAPGTGAPSTGLRGVVFATGGFASGGRGVISVAQCWPCRGHTQKEHYMTLATADDGASWRRAKVPPGFDVASAEQFNMGTAQFDRHRDVWAVSSYKTKSGALAFDATVSPDGGFRWARAQSPVPGFIGSVSVAGGEAWATSGGYCRGKLCAGAQLLRGPASGSILTTVPEGPFAASSAVRVTAAGRDAAYVQVFAKAQQARTLVTRDGGRTWQQLSDFCGHPGPDVIFRVSGPRTVWAVCPVAGPTTLLERSDDGGRHWRRYRIPAHGGIENLVPASAREAWTVSDSGYVMTSTDGGASWRTVWSAGDYHPRSHLPTLSVLRAGAATITATQTSGGLTRVAVYRTHDGGRTWTARYVPLRSGS